MGAGAEDIGERRRKHYAELTDTYGQVAREQGDDTHLWRVLGQYQGYRNRLEDKYRPLLDAKAAPPPAASPQPAAPVWPVQTNRGAYVPPRSLDAYPPGPMPQPSPQSPPPAAPPPLPLNAQPFPSFENWMRDRGAPKSPWAAAPFGSPGFGQPWPPRGGWGSR